MDFWCWFLKPLFVIVLLSGKLHFVLEHVGIAVEYFYTIFGEQKTEFGTILNFKTCHQHQPSIHIHTCKTDEKCKNPTMVKFSSTLTTSKETSMSQRKNTIRQ